MPIFADHLTHAMNDSVKYLLRFSGRVLAYAAVMVLLYLVFMHDAATATSTGKFGENSLTEIMQELFLFLLGVMFLYAGRLNPGTAPFTRLAAIFFFMAFIREFNNQIDFWFYLVLPLILLFFWLAFRDRKKLAEATHAFVELPFIAWFVTGFLVTFIFSRLFGKTSFWTTLLEAHYHRWAKNAGEEGIELLGYTLLFIAGIEMVVYFRRNRIRRELAGKNPAEKVPAGEKNNPLNS